MLSKTLVRVGAIFSLPRLAALLVLAGLLGTAQPSQAQVGSIPSNLYYLAFSEFYDGNFVSALKGFETSSQGATRGVDGLWIDSICYNARKGECYYQMGDHIHAMNHFTAALQLSVRFPDWMLRVQWPASIRPTTGRLNIPWANSTRRAVPGDFPDQMSIMMGQVNNNQVVQQGGVAQLARLVPLDVEEVIRCQLLTLRRYREMMGPTVEHDPLLASLLAAYTQRPIPPNHWSECWMDLLLGMTYSAIGKDGQAIPLFKRGLVAAGQFDHPFTCVALFELGRVAMQSGDFKGAIELFEEASYSAARYITPDGPSIIEEALRFAAMAHILSNQKTPYPRLHQCAAWAQVKQLKFLQSSLLLSEAEILTTMFQTKQAAGLLTTARGIIGNRDMLAGKLGARFRHNWAVTYYQQGDATAGDQMMSSALAFQRNGGSIWLYHIALADQLYLKGALTPRAAMDLFDNVLRDPTSADWLSSPLESLSVLVTPHNMALEHWFEVALIRKEYEKALEISDLVRRHRFFNTLGMGGRLLGLRWLLDGPQELVDPQAAIQRRDLLAEYPAYNELLLSAEKIRRELQALPLQPNDDQQKRVQAEKLEALSKISAQQELVLRQMAVRRHPSPLIFPPRIPTKELQKRLGDNQAALVFFSTARSMYAFLIGGENYTGWQISGVDALRKNVVGMLRAMGNYENNREVSVAELNNEDAWKKASSNLYETIFRDTKSRLTDEIEEVVIVPDSLMWYLPFEALQIPSSDGGTQSLISKYRLRYAPTVGLALPDHRGRKPSEITAVVVGQLYPQQAPEIGNQAFDDLAQVLPGTVRINDMPASSSVYSSLFDRLIVMADQTDEVPGPLNWAPLALDHGKPGSTLDSWLQLPWNSPDQVVLPGFHTPAENSLRDLNLSVAGQDIFLTSCTLMACGTRTILLSRWRTGGRTAMDMMREFVQELPYTEASAAWQRSVFFCVDTEVSPDQEPRVSTKAGEAPPSARHPFFWAPYLLIDTGTRPNTDQPADAAAAGQ